MTDSWETYWLSWLQTERRYPENTLLAYQRDLHDYFAFLAEHKAVAVPPQRAVFRKYLAHLQKRGLARTTVARRISSYDLAAPMWLPCRAGTARTHSRPARTCSCAAAEVVRRGA